MTTSQSKSELDIVGEYRSERQGEHHFDKGRGEWRSVRNPPPVAVGG